MNKQKVIISIIVVLITMIWIVLIDFCIDALLKTSNTPNSIPELILYYKEVPAVVTHIKYNHWYASGHHYAADVTIRSEEYNLSETMHLTQGDAKKVEGVKEGDAVMTTLYSWVNDDGKVVERELSGID